MTEKTESKPVRLLSLDAFRGLTIVLMLLVNNMALDTATPAQFMHAKWNDGVHLADFVFPWFLFCVGVAIPFSADSFKRKGTSVWLYDIRVLRRTVILFVLGCLLASSAAGKPIFTLGVLHIIALAYFVGAMLYELPLHRRLLVAALLLTAHWVAIRFLPIPGVGVGVFDEGRNIVHHINHTYLASVGLQGLPTLVPTSALVLIGTAIGDLLRSERIEQMRKFMWLMVAGGALTIGGVLWSLSVGFNKPIWTSSYILLTAGTGAIVLALFYLLIDTTGWRKWPYALLVFGSNAILVYVLPVLVKVLILQKMHIDGGPNLQDSFIGLLTAHTSRYIGGWLYTLVYTSVWWAVLWLLYRKKWFFRV